MPSITIRNVPEDVHRALRVRAARHQRSTEAEIRAILEQAAKPEGRIKLGAVLAAIGQEAGLSDSDVDAIDHLRSKAAAEPVRFE